MGVSRDRLRSLDAETTEAVGERLAALAEPTRIRLLDSLREGEDSVQGLADRLGLSHQAVSKHLAVLRAEGVVSRRRDGTARMYRLEDWGAWWLIDQTAQALFGESA